MHDVMGMHNFQPFQNALHNYLDFLGCEFMLGLDLVIELASFQKLHRDVNGVLTFIDLVEAHEVLMIELSHDLNLVDE